MSENGDAPLPLAGRLAIVTGAAGRGVGRATAYALARDGADVAVNTRRSLDAAEEVAAELRDLGRRSVAVLGDAADADGMAACLERVVGELGEPDIAVVSAGGRWVPRPFEEIPPDEWRSVVTGEIDSLYLTSRALLPGMRHRGWGRIVSVGGFDADDWRHSSADGPHDYALGKAGRHWLTNTLARAEARHGVTVNAVAPGPITRVAVEQIRGAVLGEHALDGYERPTQVDVAETIAWLCRASEVTGTVVRMPGRDPDTV
jgi:3-oxoacyl-[acyl-carrier protein] reductase